MVLIDSHLLQIHLLLVESKIGPSSWHQPRDRIHIQAIPSRPVYARVVGLIIRITFTKWPSEAAQ